MLIFSLKVLNNQIQFGVKKVGQSFNTLGNPYLQKDVKKNILLIELDFFKIECS